MGFLCCSLHTSVNTAAVLGTILSVYGATWTGYLLAFLRGDVAGECVIKVFELLYNGTNTTTDVPVIKDIVATSLSLHVIWLPTSVLLCCGNVKKAISLLKIWVFITAIIVLTDFSGMGYFIYRTVELIPKDNSTWTEELIKKKPHLPHLIIAALFSKLGTILLFVLISLMVYTWKRANEIKIEKSNLEKRRSFIDYAAESPLYYDNGKMRNAYGLDNMAFNLPRVPEQQEHSNRPASVTPATLREPEVDYSDPYDYKSRDYNW